MQFLDKESLLALFFLFIIPFRKQVSIVVHVLFCGEIFNDLNTTFKRQAKNAADANNTETSSAFIVRYICNFANVHLLPQNQHIQISCLAPSNNTFRCIRLHTD